MKIVVLAGGVGAARFLEGLVQVMSPKDITVVVNTADDEEFYSLTVCPDIDTIIYTLSNNHNTQQGWGLKDETFFVSKQLTTLGNDVWFTLGDKDFATHIHRSNLLRKGYTLTEVTKNIAKHFAIPFTILPMSNDTVKTIITTPGGLLPFQEYFVKRKCNDTVTKVAFIGIKKARPSPGILHAIDTADAIIIAPSNPIVSIQPILSVVPIKKHIIQAKAKKIAISPLVDGKAIKGPAAKMFHDLHLSVSAFGIAKYYQDLLNYIVIDEKDIAHKNNIETLGMRVTTTNTLMTDHASKIALAQTVLQSLTV